MYNAHVCIPGSLLINLFITYLMILLFVCLFVVCLFLFVCLLQGRDKERDKDRKRLREEDSVATQEAENHVEKRAKLDNNEDGW